MSEYKLHQEAGRMSDADSIVEHGGEVPTPSPLTAETARVWSDGPSFAGG